MATGQRLRLDYSDGDKAERLAEEDRLTQQKRSKPSEEREHVTTPGPQSDPARGPGVRP